MHNDELDNFKVKEFAYKGKRKCKINKEVCASFYNTKK